MERGASLQVGHATTVGATRPIWAWELRMAQHGKGSRSLVGQMLDISGKGIQVDPHACIVLARVTNMNGKNKVVQRRIRIPGAWT
eukprot:854689-Pelagomonas_calceolata.AAC.9